MTERCDFAMLLLFVLLEVPYLRVLRTYRKLLSRGHF